MDAALDPWLQYGALGLCALGLGVLFFIIKKLLKIIGNDLRHIDRTLKALPCQPDAECPAEEDS